jgi:hypothetical protein
MAIHYDPKLKRFRDHLGHWVSAARAQKSSIARREYEAAQRKRSTPKPKPKPPPPPPPKVSHAKPKAKGSPLKGKPAPKVSHAKPAPKVSRAKPKRKRKPRGLLSPWEYEGDVREYPAPDEWFPEIDSYGYDDLVEDWGDYENEDTGS